MTIYENRGARQQAWIHAHPFAGINLDGHETLPLVAAALGRGSQLAKEILLELDDFLDIHADQQRFSGGDAAFNHKNVLELVVARRRYAGALIDFLRIKPVPNRGTLGVQILVPYLYG